MTTIRNYLAAMLEKLAAKLRTTQPPAPDGSGGPGPFRPN